MQNFNTVEQNINRYIKKFYLNELIKGGILFFTALFIYFIITTALEYFLWLNSLGRAILFWSFIVFTLALFIKFICIPIAKLFRWVKGINYTMASQQIGKHFPEVSDKLLNLLQLKEQGSNDELVLAGIEQKSKELKPIPFQTAIDLSNGLKNAKYAILPIGIIIIVLLFGKAELFSESYKRVVNYQTYYQQPLPFYFKVNNDNLNVKEGQSLILNVSIQGEIIPEKARINYNSQSYFLRPLGNGKFTYTFDKVSEDLSFNLSSNDIVSAPYSIKVVKVPKILDFAMTLDYPNYTRIKDKTVQGQGSINIPEGTEIKWDIKTQTTDNVMFISKNNTFDFQQDNNLFFFNQKILKNTHYSITTSNENVQNFETLNYKIKVIKDQYPKINVLRQQDSSQVNLSYFQVNLSDDYGLTSSRLVYYEKKKPETIFIDKIKFSTGNFSQFYYTFPNENLNLKEGTTYEYYFEVFDNDGVNGRKSSQSQTFGYREKTQTEINNELLDKQSNSIDSLNSGLENLKLQDKDLKEIEKLQKEKQNFSYPDKQKMANFIKRQKQQREMMKEYMKSLKESLSEFQPEENTKEKEALQESLKNNEKMLQENEQLLEELEKYQNKLEDENLKEKLEKFSKSSKQQERSLEQLLELTKRYYVEQKAKKIAEEINNLAEKQEKLSEKSEEKESKSQDSLNKAFDKLKEELDQLEEENKKLKEPMQIERDKVAEKQADNAQQEAQESLEKSEASETPQNKKQQQKQNANQQQQKAAEQIKKMAQSMSSSMMSMSGQQQMEDAEMLKQILDNLITFSKEQESLMEDFKTLNSTNPNFAKKLRRQGQLRENFEHVDDSLFALALRNPMISDKILVKLTDIQYDIDKSIERLAETEIRLGTTSQQYVMVNANELSNMLDASLDQMQMQMQGQGQCQSSGKGKGQSPSSGFQLSDIIKSHEELQKQMQGQGQGKKPGQKQGESQGEGKSGQKSGKDGQSGQTGQDGKSGNQSGSKDGQSNNSKNAKDGKNGKNSQNGNNGKGNGDNEGDDENKRGLSNELSGELFEIYKQQQDLRNQLEDRIKELGIESAAENLQKSLDQLEEDMLMQGFSSDVLKQMENVKHQLLKLEKAAQKQGQDSKREATTNYKTYQNNSVSTQEETTKEYFESFEILNRQQLPLQTKYKNLIKQYFDESAN